MRGKLAIVALCGALALGARLVRSVGAERAPDGPPPGIHRLVDEVPAGTPVPSPLMFSSNFERIVLVRMTFGTDLLEGLEKAVAREKISNAVILSGIGSLTGYHVHAVANTTFPSKNVFIKGEGPYDLTAVNGYVVNGRVHAHITFSDDKRALAGHLEPGTRTFTFAIVTLGVFGDDVDLDRLDDKNWR
jgi:predicted DNA-binding protein with PD1-like motif